MAANPDDTHDPLAYLDRLAARAATALPTFDPLPAALSPREIELASIQLLTSAIRTATTIARLQQWATEAPESHAFADPIAHLQTLLARTEARLDELATRRQPDAIPWLQRFQLQARYEAALQRLWQPQAQLCHQAEVRQARRQQRAQGRVRRATPLPPGGGAPPVLQFQRPAPVAGQRGAPGTASAGLEPVDEASRATHDAVGVVSGPQPERRLPADQSAPEQPGSLPQPERSLPGGQNGEDIHVELPAAAPAPMAPMASVQAIIAGAMQRRTPPATDKRSKKASKKAARKAARHKPASK